MPSPNPNPASPSPTSNRPSTPTSSSASASEAEAEAAKIATLHTILTHQASTLATAKHQLSSLAAQLPLGTTPTHIQSAHIALLHQYNTLRDIGTGLLGMIAEARGVRVGEVFEEWGVGGLGE
ncbi:hypothetical protein MMC20_004783 [Loxospora ochrophaea]|nr:hypothetical protein [Loxospora ochrophaea]